MAWLVFVVAPVAYFGSGFYLISRFIAKGEPVVIEKDQIIPPVL